MSLHLDSLAPSPADHAAGDRAAPAPGKTSLTQRMPRGAEPSGATVQRHLDPATAAIQRAQQDHDTAAAMGFLGGPAPSVEDSLAQMKADPVQRDGKPPAAAAATTDFDAFGPELPPNLAPRTEPANGYMEFMSAHAGEKDGRRINAVESYTGDARRLHESYNAMVTNASTVFDDARYRKHFIGEAGLKITNHKAGTIMDMLLGQYVDDDKRATVRDLLRRLPELDETSFAKAGTKPDAVSAMEDVGLDLDEVKIARGDLESAGTRYHAALERLKVAQWDVDILQATREKAELEAKKAEIEAQAEEIKKWIGIGLTVASVFVDGGTGALRGAGDIAGKVDDSAGDVLGSIMGWIVDDAFAGQLSAVEAQIARKTDAIEHLVGEKTAGALRAAQLDVEKAYRDLDTARRRMIKARRAGAKGFADAGRAARKAIGGKEGAAVEACIRAIPYVEALVGQMAVAAAGAKEFHFAAGSDDGGALISVYAPLHLRYTVETYQYHQGVCGQLHVLSEGFVPSLGRLYQLAALANGGAPLVTDTE